MYKIPFNSLVSGPKVFYILEGSMSVLQISLVGFVAAGYINVSQTYLVHGDSDARGTNTLSPLVLWGSMYVHCGTL